MKAAVIYDSYFGNTEKIASAIGGALGSPEEVRIARVGNVNSDQLAGVELIVVGSPTRGFRPTRALSALLEGLPPGCLSGVRAAAFDTRISHTDVSSAILKIFVRIFGYAAGPIAKQLQKKGGVLIVPPEGFYVVTSEGPLKEGELERAGEWAKQML